MPRVDRLLLHLAATLLEFHRRLELRLQIGLAAKRHFGFLHQLEEIGLHTTTAHVAAHADRRTGQLIDLIEINDAILRDVLIALGLRDKIAHKVFNVAANVARLGKLRCICTHHGHADQFRETLHEIRLANAGRPPSRAHSASRNSATHGPA